MDNSDFLFKQQAKGVAMTEMGKTEGWAGELKDRLGASALHMQLTIKSQAR